MNFDDMLYYDPAELRRKESMERIKKELTKIFIKEINGQFNNNIEEKVIPKVENIVSKEVNDAFYEDTIKETQLFIAHKMIKDNLSKEQVIKYCQLSDEEYETLKKWSLINNYHWLLELRVERIFGKVIDFYKKIGHNYIWIALGKLLKLQVIFILGGNKWKNIKAMKNY